MTISFANALGIHQQALDFRAKRAEVLANNIANADTPEYKARDLDFSKFLAAEQETQGGKRFSAELTDSRHISADGLGGADDDALLYRTPANPSLDQNTVDAQVEQANYTANALDFQASFTLLNSKFKGMLTAIRGE